MKKWEVEKSSYLYRTKFGNLRTDKCHLPNGYVIEEYHVCEFDDWVNCVAITKEREIVLVKQYRHGANNFFLEIPAGSPRENETFQDAILRELMEETGCTSEKQPIDMGCFFTNPSTNNNRIHTFLLTDVSKTHETNPDDTEEIEVLFVPLIQIDEMISNGEISQLFTVCAIEHALQRFYEVFSN